MCRVIDPLQQQLQPIQRALYLTELAFYSRDISWYRYNFKGTGIGAVILIF